MKKIKKLKKQNLPDKMYGICLNELVYSEHRYSEAGQFYHGLHTSTGNILDTIYYQKMKNL